MNRRIKQFYKQWIGSRSSTISCNRVFCATEENFLECGKYINISSPSHGHDVNKRVYVEKNFHEHNYIEYLGFSFFER